ncbi:MAG: DUF3842 family protein [Nitrospiraceae bacterium]
MRVCIVDGRGGGLGRRLVERLRPLASGGLEIVGVGINVAAARTMLAAGAGRVVAGEAAMRQVLPEADLILGPLSIVLPGSMSGDVTSGMASLVLRVQAKKVLLPLNPYEVEVVGVEGRTLDTLIAGAVRRVRSVLETTPAP